MLVCHIVIQMILDNISLSKIFFYSAIFVAAFIFAKKSTSKKRLYSLRPYLYLSNFFTKNLPKICLKNTLTINKLMASLRFGFTV